MFISDLSRFEAKSVRYNSPHVRKWNGIYININRPTQSKVVEIRCDSPTCPVEGGLVFEGNIQKYIDKDIHLCPICTRKEEFIGRKFGDLTVVSFDAQRSTSYTKIERIYWNCQCKCGNHRSVNHNSLIQAITRSCGCRLHRPSKDLRPYNSYIGETIGHLLITGIERREKTYFNCRCKCGTELVLQASKVKKTERTNCGCLDHKTNPTLYTYKGHSLKLSEWARLCRVTPSDIRNRMKRKDLTFEEALVIPPKYNARLWRHPDEVIKLLESSQNQSTSDCTSHQRNGSGAPPFKGGFI